MGQTRIIIMMRDWDDDDVNDVNDEFYDAEAGRRRRRRRLAMRRRDDNNNRRARKRLQSLCREEQKHAEGNESQL